MRLGRVAQVCRRTRCDQPASPPEMQRGAFRFGDHLGAPCRSLAPSLDDAVGILDVLALLAHELLGPVEVGAQIPDAEVALLDLVFEFGDAADLLGR